MEPKYHIPKWKAVTGSLKFKKKSLMLYKEKIEKDHKKRKKYRNFEKKNAFLSHVPRITQPKRFLGQNVCSVTRLHTHTDTKVNTGDTLSGFQDVFFQPIFKDRSNTVWYIGGSRNNHKTSTTPSCSGNRCLHWSGSL